MSDPYILSGLLSAWLVGPLYGINVVMVAVIARKLWPLRANMVSRSLLLVAAVLIITCTAHAFTYLADLIHGFTSNSSQSPNAYFSEATRSSILAAFFLYVFISVCNNLFVTWRVYATWRRNKYLAAFLTTFIFASVVVNATCGHFLAKNRATAFTTKDSVAAGLFTTGWVLSIVMQISGALLIGWHAVETPKVVGNSEPKRRNISRTIFYAFIESGCLSLVIELIMVGFLYHRWNIALIFIAVLGQFSGLSAFAIILREIYKAEQDSSNGFVNVTSALAAMQMQDFSHRRAQRSVGPSDIAETHENAVMVDIETSRHEDDAEKPTSQKYRSRTVGKILLSDIETAPPIR